MFRSSAIQKTLLIISLKYHLFIHLVLFDLLMFRRPVNIPS